jgi:hypothetical protein
VIQDQKTGRGGERKMGMTWKTNFDRYLVEHLGDPAFAERLKKAGEAWDAVINESDRTKERNDRTPIIDSAVE